MTSSPAGSSRAGRSKSGRASRDSCAPSTSATAIMSARGSCCSPSTPGRSRRRWPKRRRAPRRHERRRALAAAAARARPAAAARGLRLAATISTSARQRITPPARTSPRADAVVRQRALDLEFTRVRAPVSGRISDRRADPGTLVAGGNGGGRDPADDDQRGRSDLLHLRRFRGAAAQGAARARRRAPAPQQVEIRLQDEPDYRWHGTVDFTDNGIDPQFRHDPRPRRRRQPATVS